MELPPSSQLPVSALASAFDSVVTSYKFYWFLAILESVYYGDGRILSVKKLLTRMIASVWYPIHYFRLSFGKQDQLGEVVGLLGKELGIAPDSSRARIIEMVLPCMTGRDNLGRRIQKLSNYVPYRFLRPFFDMELRGVNDHMINQQIILKSDDAFHSSHAPCLYRFVGNDEIEIHPAWFEYLKQHLNILKGFCLWHLVNYVQKNNPNVPNLAAKLFEPVRRDLKQGRMFWRTVLEKKTGLACIYSSKPLQKDEFSLDHFLPWSFVSHDLLWNLVPVPKSVNSSKSDCLPDLSMYFEPFAKLQYQAVQVISKLPRTENLLEDYVTLFRVSSITELVDMEYSYFEEHLHDTIAPQVQIASNMGFPAGWRYKG